MNIKSNIKTPKSSPPNHMTHINKSDRKLTRNSNEENAEEEWPGLHQINGNLSFTPSLKKQMTGPYYLISC
jgi:hypothetical protein